ncbi:hypothetical protein C8R45DRAFT_944351 [Mycena sanguinolenta]|nr:hypothetical protein C8R45DRAFT_944351 [Mycena sanguinolenta]
MLPCVVHGGDSGSSHRPTGTRNTHKPISRLSEQTGLPSHQTGLQADLPGLGFDLHSNPSPSPKKPVGAGASPFCKPKTSLSTFLDASFVTLAQPRQPNCTRRQSPAIKNSIKSASITSRHPVLDDCPRARIQADFRIPPLNGSTHSEIWIWLNFQRNRTFKSQARGGTQAPGSAFTHYRASVNNHLNLERVISSTTGTRGLKNARQGELEFSTIWTITEEHSPKARHPQRAGHAYCCGAQARLSGGWNHGCGIDGGTREDGWTWMWKRGLVRRDKS